MASVRQARSTDHYILLYFAPQIRRGLSTTCSYADQAFSALNYYSEVEDAGLTLVRNHGHKGRSAKRVFLLFQAFIRQGRTFFESARSLHHRASSLNYYYCFLNLAKAYVSLRDPAFVTGRVPHGLRHKFTAGPLNAQRVYVSDGMYPRFYQLLTGETLPTGEPLTIVRLLSYCSDVAHEYQSAGYGEHRTVPVLARLFSSSAQRHSFPVLAVGFFERLSQYKKGLQEFFEFFEPVEMNRNLIKATFDISAYDVEPYTFFESKKTYQWGAADSIPVRNINQDTYHAVKKLYFSEPYKAHFMMRFCAPLSRNRQIPFNEVLASYATMYYLSSLVRYQPTYLERLLGSRDAWIIERFVSSAPTTLLICLSNLILGVDDAYSTR